MKKRFLALSIILILFLTSCGAGGDTKASSDPNNIKVSGANITLDIVSGSENEELMPLIQQFAQKEKVNINMTYMGSLDIMRSLQGGEIPYDAVWPASSIWLTTGDTNHRLKHSESISITPVVFGIKESKANQLGFVGRDDISIKEIMKAIEDDKLKFTMTSATQSNSGASAYIGFLYGFAGNPAVLTMDNLNNPNLQKDITSLLSGVERSSGSSGWLKTMFLNGDYDAMVNYESLIITTNQELKEQGRELLYTVYPVDALSISDSPLAYVDKGDNKKEEAFLKLKEYLLSDEIQNEIQKYGRRTGFEGVATENEGIFTSSPGVVVGKVLSPVSMPAPEVLTEALNLYQSQFRKPPLTAYVLDYSGSMSGEGTAQVKEAMSQILIEENARKNFLQAQAGEKNIVVFFDNDIIGVEEAGGDKQSMRALQQAIENQPIGGGTDMYNAAAYAIALMSEYDLNEYSPAIILLTDGQSGGKIRDIEQAQKELRVQIPIFTILFGDADESQVSEVAEYTNARVFDGRKDLIAAFRSAKGYN